MLSFAHMAGGRPLKFQSVIELQEQIDAYFASCYDYTRDMFGNRLRDKDDPNDSKDNPSWIMKKVKAFTVTGLAAYLHTSRETLLDYEEKDGFSDTIKEAKAIIYADTENYLYGKGTATGAIFSLKNNYGWKDRSEQDITSGGRPLQPHEALLGGQSHVLQSNNSDREDIAPTQED